MNQSIEPNPQPLIGGSDFPTQAKTPMISPNHLDYLSATIPVDKVPHGGFVRLFEGVIWRIDRVKPRQGYNTAIKLNLGRLDWHTEHSEFGYGFQLSGMDLDGMRDGGVSDNDLLKLLATVSAKASRLDLAMNIVDKPEATPGSLHEMWQKSCLTTKSKQATFMASSGTKGGDTFYLGSRHSDAMLRCYDKASQQRLMGISWTRLEMELKNRKAVSAQKTAAAIGVERTTSAVIKKFMTCPQLDWYTEAIERSKDELIPPLPKSKGNTREWLERQVLPACDRLNAEDKDTLEWFLGEIARRYM